MKKAILDFTNCKYYDDLHETIKNLLISLIIMGKI